MSDASFRGFGPPLDEPGAFGPLSRAGEETLTAIAQAVQDGRLAVDRGDVDQLGCAVQLLDDLSHELNVTSSGEPRSLELLRGRLAEPPGRRLQQAVDGFPGLRPWGPPVDGPCAVGPLDLTAVVWTGWQLDNHRGRAWSERIFADYRALAGPVELVLQRGAAWMATGDDAGLRDAFEGLRRLGPDSFDGGAVARPGLDPLDRPGIPADPVGPGRVGPAGRFDDGAGLGLNEPMDGFDNPVPGLFCLDEQQVCLGALLNFAWERIFIRPSFPPLDAVYPANVCQGYTGTITVTPATGTTFPPPDRAGGLFPTIDHQAAQVLSWTPNLIVLAVAPGLAPGCHSVGFGYLPDPEPVAELREIAQQCFPWYPSAGFASLPLLIWDEQLTFSVLGKPDIVFTANGSAVTTAEACTPVTLSWSVSLRSCPRTQAITLVSMLRNGQPFRPVLATSGMLTVADADDATYTLHAVSRLGAQQCGTADHAVTVTRYKVVRLGSLPPACIDAAQAFSFTVTVSCPAPPGGLPVTVASSAPARIAGQTVTLGPGSRTLTIYVQVGSQCGPVTLTVSAPGHTSADASFVVVATPNITSLTPATVFTCDDITVTLRGDCLGDPTLPPQAVLVGSDGRPLPATAALVSAQTEARVTTGPLPAGDYQVGLGNCGRVGIAPQLLTVAHRPPQITGALTVNATAIQICSTPTITLHWKVRGAQTTRLTRGGTQLTQRTYDPCHDQSDSFTDTLPTVTSPVTYLLEVTNPVGVTVTGTRTIPTGTTVPLLSAFAIVNNASEAVNAFLINLEDSGGVYIGQYQPGQGAMVAIPDCRARAVSSLNPRLVQEHNANFNSQFDPTSVATVRTAGATWLRNTTAFRLGRPNAGTEMFEM
jgi:hypothetical protein